MTNPSFAQEMGSKIVIKIYLVDATLVNEVKDENGSDHDVKETINSGGRGHGWLNYRSLKSS